jgi:single-strand DNA-binding protein
MTTLTITGNLTADPELRFIPNGKALATFTVVSSKSTKLADGSWENTDTTFWEVKCWGKTAENVAESLTKGMSVIVNGSAVQENWEDKNTGQKRSKISVTAWNVGPDLKRHTANVGVSNNYSVESPSSAPAPASDPWSVPFGSQTDVAPF